MARVRTWSCLLLLALVAACAHDPRSDRRSAEEARAGELMAGREGGFILRDLDGADLVVLRPEEMSAAEQPCSTFKVPHALIALEEGVLPEGVATILPWDGEPKAFRSWERDHDLASAMANSVVWYFQAIARRLGLEREQAWLERLRYGNADPSSGLESFWLHGGSLRVTPEDQLRFWAGLVRRELPCRREVQEAVLGTVLLGEREGIRLYGKTGSRFASEPAGNLGWFVGALVGPAQRRIFVCRLHGAGAQGSTAKALTLSILDELGYWPGAPGPTE